MTGPVGSADNSVPTFDGVKGKLQDPDAVYISDVDLVGIGVVPTSGRLEIKATGNNSIPVVVKNSESENDIFEVRAGGSGECFVEVQNENSTTRVQLHSNGDSYFTGGQVGIGLTGPACPLHVDQSSATGAVPVITLDQGDDSEEMIEFVGTIGTGNALEAVGAKTLTTTHFIKVTLPGGLTRYIPCGTIA